MQKLYVNDKDFYKKVAGIAIPIALQGLITNGVNVMDTIMIGMVGETQLSAVSLANQFINIFHIFCMGIGMGASVCPIPSGGGDLPQRHERGDAGGRKSAACCAAE